MSHLKKELRDEEKGEHEYKELARRFPKEGKKFSRMAKDEHRHHEMLEKMERSEHKGAKHKALKKRTK